MGERIQQCAREARQHRKDKVGGTAEQHRVDVKVDGSKCLHVILVVQLVKHGDSDSEWEDRQAQARQASARRQRAPPKRQVRDTPPPSPPPSSPSAPLAPRHQDASHEDLLRSKSHGLRSLRAGVIFPAPTGHPIEVRRCICVSTTFAAGWTKSRLVVID